MIRVADKSGSSGVIIVCDFPPSNLAGGPVLLRRLFSDSREVKSVVAGSYFLRVSDALLPVPHISVPMLPPGGRPISKVIKFFLRPFFFIAAALRTAVTLLRGRKDVVVTVAHGSLFVIVLALAPIWGQRTILFVHDDWHGALAANRGHRLFGWLLRRADKVIVISRHVQSRLSEGYAIESTVFLPARPLSTSATRHGSANGHFNLTYLGSLNSTVQDAIEFVAKTVRSGSAERVVRRPVRFRLYTQAGEELIRRWGLSDSRIEVLPWVAEDKVDSVLAEADALLLPFSFAPVERVRVRTSFPTKTADYLASGVPIIVLAPPESTTAEYARETGSAIVVDGLDEQRFASALASIAENSGHVRDVLARAATALRTNHDIAGQQQAIASMVRELSLARS